MNKDKDSDRGLMARAGHCARAYINIGGRHSATLPSTATLGDVQERQSSLGAVRIAP